MGRRLTRVNLFEPRSTDSWIVLIDPWWNIQAPPKHLPRGSDLLDAYLSEMLLYHRDGWTLHEFSSLSASFFVTREGSRGWQVVLTQDDPAKRQASATKVKPM